MKNDIYITRNDVEANNAFALADNIMVKGGRTTAGSKILFNYVSPIDATVYRRLIDSGMELSGKTKLDEFEVTGITIEDDELFSGAVLALENKTCKVALCNDVFGKTRRQAPQRGLYYIRPTYGTVSRFGLIQTVSSMDQIGVACNSIEHGFEALSIIAGHDENDLTTFMQESYCYAPKEGKLKIGIPSNILEKTDEKSREGIRELTSKYSSEEFELKYFDVLSQIMCILSSAEIGNNTSRYDGVKYGYRTKDYTDLNNLYTNTRSEGLGLNMKLASIVGAMVLSSRNYERYYLKSMKIRRLIKEYCDELYSKYDTIVLPLTLEDADPYANFALYALANLCGLPSVSMPLAPSNGVQLVAQVKNENVLYGICKGGR